MVTTPGPLLQIDHDAAENTSFGDGAMRLPAMGEAASGRRWVLREVDLDEAEAIVADTDIWPPLARALAARGVTARTAARWLSPSLREDLPDPSTLADMDAAAERLRDIVLAGGVVGVFGDYDVDGATAAALVHNYLRDVGAKVEAYLPDRFAEGYGPTIEAFRALKNAGASVVVTVDCGASADAVIDQAAEENLPVIVLDHHIMQGPPPAAALAVVNPNRPDDTSGLKGLSASGVAFMAAVALNRSLREAGWFTDWREPDLRRYLDLAALGLVCDVMPMTGLTRTMVAQGLKIYGPVGNPGLFALGAAAGVKHPAAAYHFGFVIGPRINAAGRLGHARTAFRLMTSEDPAERERLAEELHATNARRQNVEAEVSDAAIARIESEAREDAVIVAAGEGWHQGVVGIVAGRIKERYDRPALAISIEGDAAKGSGRSIDGVDLGAAVVAAKEAGLVSAGGGHAMAAGFSLPTENITPFREFLNARLKEAVDAARLRRTHQVDAVIGASAVTGALARQIDSAGPFGPGNPEPVFMLSNCLVDQIRTVGRDHIACMLLDGPSAGARAIAFRAEGRRLGDALRSGRRLHLIGRVKADEFRGGEAAQFQIVDAALSLAV